jgi:hypothetical protein
MALLLGILALNSLRLDWKMVATNGSIDYRNRVTGARLLVAGQDPYHYKWSEGAPERWRDPYDNPALPITKTTVTPAVLFLTEPLAALPYPTSQLAWLLAQWGLLLGTWGLWLRRLDGKPARWLWSAAVVGFTYTLAWRHHIDRGQAYMLLVFLLAVWLSLSLQRAPKQSWAAGVVAGFLLAMRPPLLLLVVPFVALQQRRQWLGLILGLGLGVAGPMLQRGTCWADYATGMATWSEVYRTNHNPRPGAQVFPDAIEGLPIDHLAKYSVKQYVDTSVFRLLRSWGWAPVSDKLVLALLAVLVAAWFWRFGRGAPETVLLGIAAWSFIVDWFLPAYRFPYTDVMILNGLALALGLPGSRWSVRILVVLSLLSGWLMVGFHPPSRWWIYLPSFALLGVALHGLFRTRALPQPQPSPSQA